MEQRHLCIKFEQDMLPSSKTTVPESGMNVGGDSLPMASAKKCEKSRKLLAGKQVKGEDNDVNDGNKFRWIFRPQETNCPIPSLPSSPARFLLLHPLSSSQMHFLDGVVHITTRVLSLMFR